MLELGDDMELVQVRMLVLEHGMVRVLEHGMALDQVGGVFWLYSLHISCPRI